MAQPEFQPLTGLPGTVRIVGVRFRQAGKIYYFDPGDADYAPGDRVVVASEEGYEAGEVAIRPKWIPSSLVVLPLRPVLRRLGDEDHGRLRHNREMERSALQLALERAQAHGLAMKFVSAEAAFDGSRLRFFFVSDKRVDFRHLVRDLAGHFRAKIELRQIGVRDQAKMVGGIGDCGRELCCTTWMGDFEPVSIRMAKLQNLSLNPSRLSGQCGRLKCCLKYENDMYKELLKELPRIGSTVETPHGPGRVVEVMAIRASVLVDLGDGRRAVVKADELGTAARAAGEPEAAAGDGAPLAAQELEASDLDASAALEGEPIVFTAAAPSLLEVPAPRVEGPEPALEGEAPPQADPGTGKPKRSRSKRGRKGGQGKASPKARAGGPGKAQGAAPGADGGQSGADPRVAGGPSPRQGKAGKPRGGGKGAEAKATGATGPEAAAAGDGKPAGAKPQGGKAQGGKRRRRRPPRKEPKGNGGT